MNNGFMNVILANGLEEVVPTYVLDDLIRKNKIVAFQRSDGWAVIGLDPIRRRELPLTNTGERWSDTRTRRTRH